MAQHAHITPGLEKLLKEAAYAQIATLMPDGSPQVTQVWIDTDGENILVNTSQNRKKTRNVEQDPRVAINVHDPANAWRVANIRGRVVETTTDGADAHIDALAKKYLGKDTYPFRRPDEQRVIIKVKPERIHAMGVDKS